MYFVNRDYLVYVFVCVRVQSGEERDEDFSFIYSIVKHKH